MRSGGRFAPPVSSGDSALGAVVRCPNGTRISRRRSWRNSRTTTECFRKHLDARSSAISRERYRTPHGLPVPISRSEVGAQQREYRSNPCLWNRPPRIQAKVTTFQLYDQRRVHSGDPVVQKQWIQIHSTQSQIERDRQVLLELAAARGLGTGPGLDAVPGTEGLDVARPGLDEVVQRIADGMPETRPTVEEAVDQARRLNSLPISDIAADVLVIAAAAAVLRPRLSFRRSVKGDSREVEVKIDADGAEGLDTVLNAVYSSSSQHRRSPSVSSVPR